MALKDPVRANMILFTGVINYVALSVSGVVSKHTSLLHNGIDYDRKFSFFMSEHEWRRKKFSNIDNKPETKNHALQSREPI